MSPISLVAPPRTGLPLHAAPSRALARSRHWLTAVATSLGLLGLAATSGILALANHFIDELSRPHQELDEAHLPAQIAAGWRMPVGAAEPPATLQRPLAFRSASGPLLRGEFWAQPLPAPTMVVCHGYRTSRMRLRPVAALEYAHGFNVLLFDFRGHGESASVPTTGGVAEVHDLEAALGVAAAQPETLPGRIILHGFSMGATIALLAPPHPDVAAIIADSPYARLDTVLRHYLQLTLATGSANWHPLLRRFSHLFPLFAWGAVSVSRLVFRIRFGHPLVGHPEAVFKRTPARGASAQPLHRPPILLIHAAGDGFVPVAHARRIADAARATRAPLETYFVDCEGHCAAYGHDPERYVATVMRFLAERVLEPAAAQDVVAKRQQRQR